MNSRNKTVFFSVVSVLLACLLIWWILKSNHNAERSDASPFSTSHTTGSEVAASSSHAVEGTGKREPSFFTLPKPSSDSPALKLARLYSSTADKRKFFDEARLQPEAGGAYLAAKVAAECMLSVSNGRTNASEIERKSNLVPNDAPNRGERLAAIRKIHEPCLGFDVLPITTSDLARLIPEAARKNDPVFQAKENVSARYKQDGDLSLVPATLNEALNSGNPFALQEVLGAITAGTFNYMKFSTVIDGVELAPLDAKAFMVATELIPCQFGIDCSSMSKGPLEFCVEGECGLDAYQLTQIYGLPPADYERMISLHNKIIAGLQSQKPNIISVQQRSLK